MYVLYICKMYNKLKCAGIHSQNGLGRLSLFTFKIIIDMVGFRPAICYLFSIRLIFVVSLFLYCLLLCYF